MNSKITLLACLMTFAVANTSYAMQQQQQKQKVKQTQQQQKSKTKKKTDDQTTSDSQTKSDSKSEEATETKAKDHVRICPYCLIPSTECPFDQSRLSGGIIIKCGCEECGGDGSDHPY